MSVAPPTEALIVRVVLVEPTQLYLDEISAFLYDVALLNDATAGQKQQDSSGRAAVEHRLGLPRRHPLQRVLRPSDVTIWL